MQLSSQTQPRHACAQSTAAKRMRTSDSLVRPKRAHPHLLGARHSGDPASHHDESAPGVRLGGHGQLLDVPFHQAGTNDAPIPATRLALRRLRTPARLRMLPSRFRLFRPLSFAVGRRGQEDPRTGAFYCPLLLGIQHCNDREALHALDARRREINIISDK